MRRNRFRIPQAIIAVLTMFFALSWLEFVPNGSDQPGQAHAEMMPGSIPIAINKDSARLQIEPKIKDIWQLADQTKGLRALQHQEILPPGTEVKPAFGIGSATQNFTCENSCWLFFVDKSPGAHFSHPVSIILIDAVTGDEQTMETEWWPEISEPNIEPKQLFNTREMRMNPEMIIFEEIPFILPDIQLQDLAPQLPLNDAPLPASLTCDGCLASAIIVCGYDDLPDTFDEDTNGMYAVLKSLGLSDDNIFYLSPHASHPGVDRPTSKANVLWAIQQVADQTCENDKILFFYSSHGGIDGLTCINQGISSTELDSWLDTIEYKEMSVIIEACHSGSFIGLYQDGTYVPAEDELTGAGESKRVVFTSASTDTSSYPDIDGSDDPNETTDIGSESIYGYIMAFGVSGTDTNGDGAVSFMEGVQYALDNDVTLIRGDNTPQFSSTIDLDPAQVHHYCYPTSDPNGPYSEACVDGGAEFMLDGSGSYALPPCDGSLTYAWETKCPAAVFSDPSAVSPTLTLSPINQCVDCDVWLTVTCSDGSTDTRLSNVTTTDSVAPSITCPANAIVECDQSTDPANTGTAEVSDNCDGTPQVTYADAETPGACAQERTITRIWTAIDACGNEKSCEQIIEVVDTSPPVIENIMASPNTLWPPNHKMREVSVSVTATDNCAPSPQCIISSVNSNEPANGVGDGNTAPDWRITGDLSVELRAERSGTGDGRNYTIAVSCTDECGNITVETTSVTVQHNR